MFGLALSARPSLIYLKREGIPWKYYGSKNAQALGLWMAPNSIAHICNVVAGACQGTEWTTHVKLNPSQVLNDISTNCDLARISWVIPRSVDSDHAELVTTVGGSSWVASIVNAVGNSKCKNADGSSYWNSTAILITWDDWGGWYDHEPPTIEAYPQGGYQMGFRVQLIVVSAYTPAKLISNTPEDFGSVFRFAEKNFGIKEGALTFADERSFSDLRWRDGAGRFRPRRG